MKIKTMEMVRKIRNKHYEEIKNLTDEEIIEYFRKKAKSYEEKRLHKKTAGHFI